MKTIRLNIPVFMLEVLLVNPTGRKRDREKTAKVEDLIHAYIKSPDKFEKPSNSLIELAVNNLTNEKIINNFSIVIEPKEHLLFKKQALLNLRTEKMQGLYMMLIIYNLLLRKP